MESVASEADALLSKYGREAKRGPKCSVGVSPHRALIEALLDRGMTRTHVSETLKSEKGAHVSPTAIARHRRKLCQCGR